MSNENITIKCLQCGSTDIANRYNGGKFCRDCGAEIVACAICGSYNIGKSYDGKLFCRDCGARGDEIFKKSETGKGPSPAAENPATPFIVAPVGAVPFAGGVSKSSAFVEEKVEPTGEDEEYKNDEDEYESDSSLEAVICPQCGSNDIVKGPDGLHYCHACGTKIIVRDNDIEGSSESDEISVRGHIRPEIDKDAFLRKAFIEVFEADTPSDIFDSPYEFEETTENILYDNVVCDVNYTATIGTYREEQYVEMEKRTERVYKYADRPATDDEIRNGQYVTVTREVPVTKTRTVTDWSPFSSSASGLSSTEAVTLDGFTGWSSLFCGSFEAINKKSILPVSREEENELILNDKAINAVNKLHVTNIQNNIAGTLPGDTYKNLHCDFHNEKFRHSLFVAPVYKLTMKNHGEDFYPRCYPFGDAKVDVGYFSKSGSATDETNDKLWKSVAPLSILTILALIASIVVSFTVKSIPAVCISFGAALILFIVTCVTRGVKRNKIKSDIKSLKLDALNKLLGRLGLEKYKGYRF